VITLESFRKMLANLGEEMPEEESKSVFEKNAGEKMYLDFQDFLTIFKRVRGGEN
jgi:Ca2+-binding EF-hand superfamily protein